MSAYIHGKIPAVSIPSPARLFYATTNRKLAPVGLGEFSGDRLRPVALGPYCSATYVSIDATCPDSCRFKEGACYVRAGFTGKTARLLDDAARGLTPEQVIAAEVRAIDRAFGGRWGHREPAPIPQDGARGGRDLRLHVGGDVPSTAGAHLLAGAAERWMQRGGGRVWTFTHRWSRIAREAFGPISVLASVETASDANRALERGYVPAIVVPRFPSERAFKMRGLDVPVVPCPAETRKRTCVTCRLCLDDSKLARTGVAIAFAVHGQQAGKVRLPQIREAA